MPNWTTVWRWLEKDSEFAREYARAHVAQAEVLSDKIRKQADETTPENANAMKVKIGTSQWLMERMAARKYGKLLAVTDGEGKALFPSRVEIVVVDPKK